VKVVLCNAPPDQAERIARALVDARVAACVNLVPAVISIYRWKGNVEREPETTMLIKTADDRVADVMTELRKLHPYEVPEMVVLPVMDVNADYGAWVEQETRPV
jgi:periplasmic divalent cation tolerance protein